jgi:hypothetical protein
MKNTNCNCGCEQLLTEINYIRDVEMKDLEQEVQHACNVINQLYDMVSTGSYGDLEFADDFIRDNYIPTEKEIRDSLDDLPF